MDLDGPIMDNVPGNETEKLFSGAPKIEVLDKEALLSGSGFTTDSLSWSDSEARGEINIISSAVSTHASLDAKRKISEHDAVTELTKSPGTRSGTVSSLSTVAHGRVSLGEVGPKVEDEQLVKKIKLENESKRVSD